jgi:hypothetical protein
MHCNQCLKDLKCISKWHNHVQQLFTYLHNSIICCEPKQITKSWNYNPSPFVTPFITNCNLSHIISNTPKLFLIVKEKSPNVARLDPIISYLHLFPQQFNLFCVSSCKKIQKCCVFHPYVESSTITNNGVTFISE